MNGGKFYLVGSIIGAVIVQTLTTTIYAFGVPPEIAQVVKALVVWIISLLQSGKFRSMVSGWFGKRELAA
jgi:simple sugar transport system permease protein